MADPSGDHVGISDTFASRRYFRKFESIMQHMLNVAGVMEAENKLNADEVEILTRYAVKLTHSFKALSLDFHKSITSGYVDRAIYARLGSLHRIVLIVNW